MSLLVLCQCRNVDKNITKENFHRQKQLASDVWRIPIKYPYELITAYCCIGWNCDKKSSLGQLVGSNMSVDSINVFKSNMTYYGSFGNNLPSWNVVDLNDGHVNRYSNKTGFNIALNEIGISNELFLAETVFEKWKDGEKLVW